MQAYVNLKAYKDFDWAHRAHGWNGWVTLVLSPNSTDARHTPTPRGPSIFLRTISPVIVFQLDDTAPASGPAVLTARVRAPYCFCGIQWPDCSLSTHLKDPTDGRSRVH